MGRREISLSRNIYQNVGVSLDVVLAIEESLACGEVAAALNGVRRHRFDRAATNGKLSIDIRRYHELHPDRDCSHPPPSPRRHRRRRRRRWWHNCPRTPFRISSYVFV